MAQTQHLPALLGSVGLGHLAPRLQRNEIDWDTARLMKSQDLAEVGLTAQEASLFRAAVTRCVGVFTRDGGANMIRPLESSEVVRMSTFARGVRGVDPGALVSYVTTRLGEASDVRPLARAAPPLVPPKPAGRWQRGVTLTDDAPPPPPKKAPPPPTNAWAAPDAELVTAWTPPGLGSAPAPAEPAWAAPHAWAAAPGPAAPVSAPASAWAAGAPFSAGSTSFGGSAGSTAPLSSRTSSLGSASGSPPQHSRVMPLSPDEQAQLAMMASLRAWVRKQPRQRQLMSEVHHFWTAHPRLRKPRERMTKVVERHAPAFGMRFRKLPAPDGGVLEIEKVAPVTSQPPINAWSKPHREPEVTLDMGRPTIAAAVPAPMPWNPLLDAVVGEPARRAVPARADDAASQALIQQLLTEDRETLAQQPRSKPRPKPRRTEGSAFDPLPTVESARRRVDAFLLKHPKVDKRGTAALRRLEPCKQVRLVRRLEADQHKSEVDGVLVLASIKDNNNFAATGQELQKLCECLRPVADRLALSSDAVAKLYTLSRDDQLRVATRFDEPGYLDDLRNVEGFVKCCFHDRGDPLRRLLRGRPMEPLLVQAVQNLDLDTECITALRKLALRRQNDVAVALASIDASSVSSSTLLAALEDGSLFDGGLQARLARPHLNKWARPDSFTDSVVSSTSSSGLSALGAW